MKNFCDKIIITNTTTEEDVDMLRQRGVSYLVTTTPRLAGRYFGTNVLEALFVALGYRQSEYVIKSEEIGMEPQIIKLTCLK